MAVTHPGIATRGSDVSRRNLLRILWGIGLLAFLVQTGVIFLDFFRPRKIGAFGSVLAAGKADEFAVGSVTRFAEGKFYLSHVPEGFLALYQKCPHLGCVVPWEPEQQTEDHVEAKGRFNCPCHGSIYNRYGVNVAGPAPRPMDLMEVKIDNGQISVNTGKITERGTFEPSQAVPA